MGKSMSWFKNIFASGVGSFVEQIGNTVDKFHLSGEEKQQLLLDAEAILQRRDSEIEQTIRRNLEAKERILVAELKQGDTYTKRARPTVVYFGLVMIGLNYFALPAALLLSGNSDMLEHCSESPTGGVIVCNRETLFPLPDEFWIAWGGIVATWSLGRSAERRGANNKMVRGITGSRQSILLEGAL